MTKSSVFLLFCAFGICTSACTRVSSETKTAKAILSPTKGNDVRGNITFTVVDGGVKIVAIVNGLTPGEHGFHVHEHGDCSAKDGSSAGAHFNPTNTKHGGPDDEIRHVGDLGNLEADAEGYAYYERIDTVIALSGANNIIGKSIIVHEKADDFKTQPTGDSGARVACGLIVEGS